MFKFNSIRFKISVLYVLVLGVILIIYSSILYSLLQRVLYNDIDDHLQIKAHELSDLMNVFSHATARVTTSFSMGPKQLTLHRDINYAQLYAEGLKAQIVKSLNEYELKNDYVALWTEQGELIAGSDNISQDILNRFHFYAQLSLLEQEKVSNLQFTDEPLRLITSSVRMSDGGLYIIQIATSTKGIRKIAQRLLRIILWSLPCILILASSVGRWLTINILKPVRAVARTAEEITHDDLGARVQVKDVDDEMQYLVQAFNRMIVRLEQSFKHISEFSSYVAHELKTPLAVIRGESEIALRKERSPAEYQEALKANLKAAERVIRITEDLLLLSRLGYESKSLEFKEINLSHFLQEIYEQAKILAESKNIQAGISGLKENIMINADELYLRRLFLNLIDNAIKFTSEGGKLNIEIQQLKKNIQISISDTGVGISEADLPQIFNKFFHRDKPGAPPGHGLGLSIADSIARAHHGEIKVTSQPGEGTTFTVILPVI